VRAPPIVVCLITYHPSPPARCIIVTRSLGRRNKQSSVNRQIVILRCVLRNGQNSRHWRRSNWCLHLQWHRLMVLLQSRGRAREARSSGGVSHCMGGFLPPPSRSCINQLINAVVVVVAAVVVIVMVAAFVRNVRICCSCFRRPPPLQRWLLRLEHCNRWLCACNHDGHSHRQ